jgi:hypothetical protein
MFQFGEVHSTHDTYWNLSNNKPCSTQDSAVGTVTLIVSAQLVPSFFLFSCDVTKMGYRLYLPFEISLGSGEGVTPVNLTSTFWLFIILYIICILFCTLFCTLFCISFCILFCTLYNNINNITKKRGLLLFMIRIIVTVDKPISKAVNTDGDLVIKLH